MIADRKNYRICVILVAILITTVIISAIAGAVLLARSFKKQPEVTFSSSSLQLGDYNSETSATVITLDPGIHLVSLSLLHPQEQLKAFVYTSSSRPLLSSKIQLDEIRIPLLEGRGRYNYNYYGGDEPIFLHPGSILSYSVEVTYNGHPNAPASCPYRLFLFDSFYDYNLFRDGGTTFKAVATTPCSTLRDGFEETNFTITNSASYYVAIDINTNYLVASNASVISTNYNTSRMNHPSTCAKALTVTNPSCNFTLCNSFYCDQSSNIFLLVEVNTLAHFSYSYQESDVIGKLGITGFVFSCLLFVAAGVAILVVIGITAYHVKIKRNKNTP